MGIKQIFKDGMKEFKRRSSLGKEKKNLKEKQKQHSEQLTALGKKAWESHIDIAEYGGLEKVIVSTQDRLDESKEQQRKWEERKQELEAKKTHENETYDSQREEVEAVKKEVDARISEEKKILKEAQRESSNVKSRLSQIDKETERLNKKVADAETPDPEKADIRTKLRELENEKNQQDNRGKEAAEKITGANKTLEPIEAESAKHQKEIDRIRVEQKAVIGELDKSLAENKTQLSDLEKKQSELDNEQSSNFEQLGEHLSGSDVKDASLIEELSEVRDTERAIAVIKREVEKLEGQGSDKSRGAYWKMIGLSAAIVVLIIGLIWFISWLVGPKTPQTPEEKAMAQLQKTLPGPVADMLKNQGVPGAGTRNNSPGGTPTSPQDVIKNLNDATKNMKNQADKLYGKKIVIADKTSLSSVLPTVSGWEMSEPNYRSQQFGQMGGSHLSATYKGPDSRQVRVNVSDTGHASALIRTWAMMFSLNRSIDNERKYEKVSTYNGIQVIEKYDKRNNRGEFTFIVKNRYIITLKTRGEGAIELLKQFIGKFDTSKLQ